MNRIAIEIDAIIIANNLKELWLLPESKQIERGLEWTSQK
jgi:hypothetical protein